MSKLVALQALYRVWWYGARIEDLDDAEVIALERMYQSNDLGAKNFKDFVYCKLRQQAESEANQPHRVLV